MITHLEWENIRLPSFFVMNDQSWNRTIALCPPPSQPAVDLGVEYHLRHTSQFYRLLPSQRHTQLFNCLEISSPIARLGEVPLQFTEYARNGRFHSGKIRLVRGVSDGSGIFGLIARGRSGERLAGGRLMVWRESDSGGGGEEGESGGMATCDDAGDGRW